MKDTPYDLVILNATIVDGSGAEPFTGDVAVRGERIERIGNVSAQAKRTIDAYGKVLAPGFIDFHGHSDYSLLMDPRARSKIFQGVTTEVGGNCGYHAAPVFGQVAEERRHEYGLSGGLEVDWSSFTEYRERFASVRPSINYAQQIGYNTLRSAVTGDRAGVLSSSEREQLRTLIRRQYAEGVIGLSYGLAYTPACFAPTEELVDAAEESAAAGGYISFHIRNEDDQLIESLEEALYIGRQSRARVHVGHLKTFRRPNWHKIGPALEVLEAARAEGMDLTVDRYPHLAMNTQLKYALPQWVLEGGVEAMRARLREEGVRERIRNEMQQAAREEAGEVLISLVSLPQNKDAEGRFLDDLARGSDPWTIVCDLVASEGDAVFATFFGMNQDNLDRILGLEYTIIASDSSIQAVDRQAGGGRPHPRCFDTFPFFIAEWVYSREQIDLAEAIHRITLKPAMRAGFTQRGRIAEGYFADLVLFDPEDLKAHVDYEEPIHYPAGIHTVVVNGGVVVERGRHTGERPGRFLESEHVKTG